VDAAQGGLERRGMSRGRVADVPASIGPVVFGVGVGWVTIRGPRQYDELMRRVVPPGILVLGSG